jgi:hypothetical protein
MVPAGSPCSGREVPHVRRTRDYLRVLEAVEIMDQEKFAELMAKPIKTLSRDEIFWLMDYLEEKDRGAERPFDPTWVQ